MAARECAMPMDNVAVIKSIYEAFARGDVPAVVERMHPRIEWREADNFPYADKNPYVGPDAILQGVFTRLATEWDSFRVDVDDVLGLGDHVLALGRYRARYKRTGRELDAQCAHVWWLSEGKVTRFQQYTDTHQVRRVVEA
jgi:ketosteroid isomerase-like protein